MDKLELPCSTSFLLTLNFDCLKQIIEFFHKNLNLLNQKINDLNKKYKNFEDLKSQINENKIKTESGLRLLNELDNRMSNYGQNILQNSEKSKTNEFKIKEMQGEIERLKSFFMKENDDGMDLNKLIESHKELKEEVEQANFYNKDNIEKLNQKVKELDEKMENLRKTDINNINNVNNNVNIHDEKEYEKEKEDKTTDLNEDKKESDENKEKTTEQKKDVRIDPSLFVNPKDDNKLYELTRRVDVLEFNVSKLSDKNYAEMSPISPSDNKITELKETRLNEAGNNFNSNLYAQKLNEFNEKLEKIESDVNVLKSLNNNNLDINIPLEEMAKEKENTENEKSEKSNEQKDNEDQKENEENEEKEEEPKEKEKEKKGADGKFFIELMSQISQLNSRLNNDELLKRVDFNKYTQKIELQLKDYNDKFNKIFQKDALRNKLIEDMSRNNKMASQSREDTSKKSDKKDKGDNGNYVTYEMFQVLEEKNRDLIINYLSEFDLSGNPSIAELRKYIDENKNSIKDLFSKIDEIILTNTKNNDYYIGLIDNLKKDLKSNIKKVENEVERISTLQEELDFMRTLVLGHEEEEKYQKMTKEEKKNELLLGTSVKEDLNIHSNYLKKLSEGLNKINNRINNINKETLVLIKKDLKSESNIILEDFKVGLKDSIGRIERQLRDKVDKLGLDEFWNKINDQLVSEMRDKIDKKELNKNNILLKRKIDNLESKISRTLVDTLIDLQMDEAPLVVKRNFRDIREMTGPKCASCGQNLPNGIVSSSIDFTGSTPHKVFKQKNYDNKDKLPDIKQTFPK